MKGTWQTTDSGGSGLVMVVAVIAAAAVAVPVLTALARVLELLAVAVVAVAVLAAVAAVAAAVAAVARRLRQGRAMAALPLARARVAVAERQPPVLRPPAVEAPREVHIHIHAPDAETAARILRDVNPRQD